MHVMNSNMKLINPFDLQVDDYDVKIIARTLSRMCRFWSQTSHFYSVAQHCLEMDRYFQEYYIGDHDKDELSKMALIHELFEAMTGLDIPSPYKHLFQEYVSAEYKTLKQFSNLLGITFPFPNEFKEIDTAMMVSEAITYISDDIYWHEIAAPLPIELTKEAIPMEVIEKKFLTRWEEIFGVIGIPSNTL